MLTGNLTTFTNDSYLVTVGAGGASTTGTLQNGNPGQARLRSLQNEKLKQRGIVPDRNTPLFVVVFNVKWIIPTPAAARYHLQSP